VSKDWNNDCPAAAGYYWYRHPSTYEQPSIVRVDAIDGDLRVYFTGMSAYAPIRMLAGGDWAGPIRWPE